MSRRRIAWGSIAVLFLLALAGLRLGWFASPPLLTIHLRCKDAATGRLSISILSETGESRGDKNIDLKTACEAGKVELDRYRSEQSLRIRMDRGDGVTSELSAQYGSNIQRDQEGFFTVVRITSTPPFLANDSI